MENQRIVPILLTGNSLQIAQSDHDFENISCTWPILLGFYAGSVHVRSATCPHTSLSSAYLWRAFPVSVVHSLLKNTALPSGRCPLPPHEKATAYSRSYVVVITPFGVLLLVYKADVPRGRPCKPQQHDKRCDNYSCLGAMTSIAVAYTRIFVVSRLLPRFLVCGAPTGVSPCFALCCKSWQRGLEALFA